MRRWACAVALALLLAPAAGAADTTGATADTGGTTTAGTSTAGTTGPLGITGRGGSVEEPFAPSPETGRLTKGVVIADFLAHPKVAHWLERYPPNPQTNATFDKATQRWTVMVWSGLAGEVALGKVDDADGRVIEAFTGPQVAWGMARGRVGAFGGKILNAWWMWTALSVIFFLGLVDRRRIRSWHTADLLALLSFGFSLLFFNRGHIFMSASLGALPLAYLVVRTSWIGFRGRRANPALSWPVWLLAGFAVFLGGLRIGLNLETPRGVIDVGLAGVIGADRILDGQAPYGHMPDTAGRACGPADSDGAIRDHIQTNGRCEAANARGDTYGPMAYLAYIPAVLALGWSGQVGLAAGGPHDGDRLRPDRHPRPVSRRSPLRGHAARNGTRLRLDRVPFHRLRDERQLQRHDHASDPRLGILAGDLGRHTGCDDCACRLDEVRRAAAGPALAHLSERAPSPQRAEVRDRVRRRDAGGVLDPAVRTEPHDGDALFVNRTLGYQLDRESPFSPWDWGQYHAGGIPNLHVLQVILQVAALALAGVVAAIPLRKGPLELAALSAAVLVGFELTLTHWSYLYIPWFLPFVLLALLLPRREPALEPRPEEELSAALPEPL